MRPLALFAGGAAILVAALTTTSLLAGPDTVKLPENYQQSFVNYLDVDRYDRKRVRKMYVSPAAHEAAQAGEDLPDGTVLIMEDHDARLTADGVPEIGPDGRFVALDPVTNIFVMEKNSAWDTANGSWDYAWYGPDGKPSTSEFAKSMDGCFTCHANREERDYTFTYWKFVSDQAK